MSITSPIIIMGAGISGLALAQGFAKASIPFHVYERDSRLNVRAQGYRVRINGHGVEALKQLLAPQLYARAAPPVHLDAITGEPFELKFPRPRNHEIMPFDVQPLNADRAVLRMVLAKDSGITVHFTDGASIAGSPLVGADGSKSRVRSQLLPNHKNVDTEGRWVFGKTTITPALISAVHPSIVSQMTLVQDRSKPLPTSLLLEPVRFKDNQYRSELPAIYWVVGSRKDTLDISDSDLVSLTREEAASRVLQLTSNWEPSIKALFEYQDFNQASFLKIYSAKPDLPVWETEHGVTLIGDAIHAMSPTAGVGAVTALRSAAALFRAIEKGEITKTSLRIYEDDMREFAGGSIRQAFFGGKMLFGMRSFEELIADNEGKK